MTDLTALDKQVLICVFLHPERTWRGIADAMTDHASSPASVSFMAVAESVSRLEIRGLVKWWFHKHGWSITEKGRRLL